MSQVSVVNVELLNCADPLTVYDIAIDEDESFLLANGVIAHNSTICIARNGARYTADADHTPIGHDLPYLSGVPYHPLCRSQMATVLEDGGAVAQETTAQWLRRQGAAYQDEVLGPTRGQMFRDGKLSPRQLLEATTGRPLTLEELGA